MIKVKLSVVLACLQIYVVAGSTLGPSTVAESTTGPSTVAESTTSTSTVAPNLSISEIKLKLRDFMNYPVLNNTDISDSENDYKYYRCGTKGIKAFDGVPKFTSPVFRSICKPIENLEFNNYKDNCGIGDRELTETPWLVSVMVRNFSGNGTPLYRATGSIIHPRLVLVPQEPFEPFSDKKLMIRSNGQTQTLLNDNMNTQNRAVSRIEKENFTSMKFKHFEKSLLVLSEPILFNQYAQSICLPNSDDQYRREGCYVLGWNRLNKMVKLAAELKECNDLKQRRGTVVPKEFFVCTDRKYIDPFKEDANYCIENQMCDFSTVLLCPAVNQPNIFYQVGIGYMVSNKMGYFLSTVASKLWIDQTVNDLQFKSQYYTRNNNESQST